MSDPKKRLLEALEASRKAQGLLEEIAREERIIPTPPLEAETDQSTRPVEEPPSGSDASEPS